MQKYQIIISIIAPILSFAGALIGVYFGNRLQRKSWRRQFDISNEKEILSEKIKLLERVAAVIAKRQNAVALANHIKRLGDRADIALAMMFDENGEVESDKLKKISKNSSLNVESVFTMKQQLDELSAEFAAAANLTSVYFSSHVGEQFSVVKNIPWYNLSEENYQKIITSMGNEILVTRLSLKAFKE